MLAVLCRVWQLCLHIFVINVTASAKGIFTIYVWRKSAKNFSSEENPQTNKRVSQRQTERVN
jgi:hypothetical protein